MAEKKQAASLEPDSFRGKVYLLVLDKLVIGAVLACAFVVYDRWKVSGDRRYEETGKRVQLDFERAKLVKEFVPAISNPSTDVVTKAYLIRAAAVTGAVDQETAIELGRSLIPAGIEESHFRRVMAAAMPGGVPAVARHATAMATKWQQTHEGPFGPNAAFNPESGREHIPEEIRADVIEARLWRAVILDALPKIDGSFTPLQAPGDLSLSFFGLYVIMNPGDQLEAIDFSHSLSRGISAVGNVRRVFFDPSDREAAAGLTRELVQDHASLATIAYANSLIAVLSTYGPPRGGDVSVALAQVMTEPMPPNASPSVRSAHYWLQWRAGELLDRMRIAAQDIEDRLRKVNPKAKPFAWAGVRPAESILVANLRSFAEDLKRASGDDELNRISTRYESGKLVRRMVVLLGGIRSPATLEVLRTLMALGQEKLRHFPFLEEDVKRTIEKVEADSTTVPTESSESTRKEN